MAKWIVGLTGFQLLAWLGAGWASANPPACMDRSQTLPIDNAKVLELKKTAPLGKSFRAHVSGNVTRVFPDKSGHAHFEIRIGEGPKEVLEVVYSEDFGAMPNPRLGAYVEACGDFINSYAKNNGYPPSPSGAIIHWVHRSNSANHDSGYVLLDNTLYGYGEDARPRRQFEYELEFAQ